MLLAIQGKLHQTKFNSAGEFFQTTENCLIFQKKSWNIRRAVSKKPSKIYKIKWTISNDLKWPYISELNKNGDSILQGIVQNRSRQTIMSRAVLASSGRW